MGKFPLKIVKLGDKVEIMSKSMAYSEVSGNTEDYHGLFSGGGLEFKEFREYTPGADSRHIAWKASLRSDKLLIKEFYQEKGLDVVFVYDVSESMLFGSEEKVKAHYAAEFILALSGVIVESNYNVGLVCYSDKINQVLMPSSDQKQLSLMMGLLSDHSTYGGSFDMGDALDFVSSTFSEGTIVIFVSDFIGHSDSFMKYQDKMKVLSKEFDVISVILRDPRDEFMVSDSREYLISDPFTGKEILITPSKIKKKYEKFTKAQRDKLISFLEEANSEYFSLYTNKSFIADTLMFFKRRAIQWR